MPHCFINSVQFGKGEVIHLKKFQSQQSKNDLKPDFLRDQINNSVQYENDWSSVDDMPFVTRWCLEKIPLKKQTMKYSKPIYDSPPLSEISDDESNEVSSYNTNYGFGVGNHQPQEVQPADPSELHNLLNALSTLSRQPDVEAENYNSQSSHVCSFCNKSFERAWLLKGHLRLHTGERPFTCPCCHKTFADRSNLRAHQRSRSHHEWEWKCQECGKAFSQYKYMVRHCQTACVKYLMSVQATE